MSIVDFENVSKIFGLIFASVTLVGNIFGFYNLSQKNQLDLVIILLLLGINTITGESLIPFLIIGMIKLIVSS